MELTILDRLRRLNRIIAILVGVLLLGCAAFVLADIVLRQVGSSFGGTDEISGYVMAIATSWGMAYALTELGHVRIDILRSRAAQRGRAVFDLVAMLALSGTITLIAIKGWPVLARSLANSSRANTPLETPLAMVQAPWLAGWIWFALTSWVVFTVALVLIARGKFSEADAVAGTYGELDALK
ncbi:TRAP transporter small permease subunit [Thetidibacter halocola]|jgi:TRAP-type C4-dicarboxylate transport system permease small subunit|uniref:TRAP transporter small permease protein n=1 Tax=Thetidibacter halocola TaxID=2827239 RepID=A0A8J7WFI3_9RHOB|nr:TRAP transporter small permease [Thetidibacter halocola]MBS0126715.1 TRAP transporter small permease [Thetidibacter halocola]